MNKTLPPIYFYIPEADWPRDIPETAEDYWQWQCSRSGTYNWSLYNWTLQTYLRLKDSDFPCFLSATMPTEGIVVAHRYSLPDDLKPTTKLLMVCLQADKARHPYAQLHVVQNPLDDVFRQGRALWPGEYLPLWPQPGLIPRDPTRGSRFENIAYVGRERELAPELQGSSWQENLKALGLRWQILSSKEQWHNYREVDAIVAVRSFHRQSSYSWKPPSKLVNAWHAGVPAILGRESAYQSERQSELDYLEVRTPAEAIAVLKRLQDDRAWRHAIMENSRVRAEELKPEKLVERWRKFLLETAVPAWERWSSSSSLTQQSFLLRRYLFIKTKRWRSRLLTLRGAVARPVKSLLSQSS